MKWNLYCATGWEWSAFFCAQRCTVVPSRIVVLRRSHIYVQTVLSMSGSGSVMMDEMSRIF